MQFWGGHSGPGVSSCFWVDLAQTWSGRNQPACEYTSLVDRLESCPCPWYSQHLKDGSRSITFNFGLIALFKGLDDLASSLRSNALVINICGQILIALQILVFSQPDTWICFGRYESHVFDDIIEPFYPCFNTRFETIKFLVEDENETFQFFKLWASNYEKLLMVVSFHLCIPNISSPQSRLFSFP